MYHLTLNSNVLQKFGHKEASRGVNMNYSETHIYIYNTSNERIIMYKNHLSAKKVKKIWEFATQWKPSRKVQKEKYVRCSIKCATTRKYESEMRQS